MKSVISLLVFLSFFSFAAVFATEMPKPTQQETAIKVGKTVQRKDFSVDAPAGWSYTVIEAASPGFERRIDGKLESTSTGYIDVVFGKDFATAETYVGIHDATPKANPAEGVFKNNKDKSAKISDRVINGQSWKIVEYMGKNSAGHPSRQWYAVTHLKNKDLYLLAGTVQGEFEKQILPIIDSIVVTEK